MSDALAVVIIGAGPCGLAIAARLVRDCRAAGLDEAALLARLVVVDPAGSWLDEWRAQLGAQRVATLRSPSFVHPHPSRVIDDALRAFAVETGRVRELQPLPATPGWAAPSASLFADFCARAVISPFGLGGLVTRGTAVAVARCAGGAMVQLADGSQLRTRAVVLALGPAGVPNVPQWARDLRQGADAPPRGVGGRVVHVSALRAAAPTTQGVSAPAGLEPAPVAAAWVAARGWLARLILPLLGALSAADGGEGPTRRLLIVGGGLSAAQLALMATDAHSGWSDVVLCARRPLTVRPFDIATTWMARHWSMGFDEAELAFYRETSPAGRANALATARDGGSVTPEAYAALRARARPPIARAWWWPRAPRAQPGRAKLELREGEVVVRAAHESAIGAQLRVCVHFARADDARAAMAAAIDGGASGATPQSVEAGTAITFDEIWLATGSRVDVASGCLMGAANDGALPPPPSLALLASVQAQWPAAFAAGRPALTPTLRWVEGAPVYVCGNLSALEIGPDAFNLAGGGAGAARISRDLLPQLADIVGVSRLGTR